MMRSQPQGDTSTEPTFLVIGQILRPHGVRGELRVRIITSYPERLKLLDVVEVGTNPEQGEATRYDVERVRLHLGYGIVKLAGVDDRDEAEMLRDRYLMVSLRDAVPLEEGEFYHYQLIGLGVYTDSDEYLGDVQDILETGANDVYVLQSPEHGEVLIPAIESVVQSIDLQSRRIVVTPLPGLLPDDS